MHEDALVYSWDISQMWASLHGAARCSHSVASSTLRRGHRFPSTRPSTASGAASQEQRGKKLVWKDCYSELMKSAISRTTGSEKRREVLSSESITKRVKWRKRALKYKFFYRHKGVWF